MLATDLRPHRKHVPAGQPEQRLFVMLQVRPRLAESQPVGRANLAFVVDGSGSMHDGGRGGLVLSGLKGALAPGALLPGDRVAVIRFNECAEVLWPLGPPCDAKALRALLTRLNMWGGGTRLAPALQKAEQQLDRARGARRVVLLTDGRADDAADTLAVARRLAAAGVSVTTLGVGQDWNEALLLRIADVTGGHPIHLVPGTGPVPPPSLPVGNLAGVLATELQRVRATTLSNLRLMLHPAPGCQVARVTRVFPTLREAIASPHGWELGPIEAGVTTTFLVEWMLPSLPPGALTIARAEVQGLTIGGGALPAVPLDDLIVDVTPDLAAAGVLDVTVMEALHQRNLDDAVQRVAEEARRDPARARELLERAKDLTLRLRNHTMTAVVEHAISDLKQGETLSPAAAKRLAVGGKTQTVALAGLAGLPSDDEIRRITGV
jgi:Ca-activated chloride channel family protein